MPVATLTSKGQITLPKPIRELLKLHPGDAVDFVVDDRGDVRVRAGRVDVRDLQGALHRPGRKPVSLAAMDRAIREARAKRA
jgi:AbrB family looped-hinge helix DNA binding protein